MQFNVLTLFPEFFESPLACGMLAKGERGGQVSYNLVNPRDFTEDKHHTVDDRPYGGGPGMVMQCDPLAKALESVEKPGRVVYLSPRGKKLDQSLARELAQEEALTLVCGRYEGVDQRFLDLFGVEEISVGDFVLNGGEAGALCLIESVARLVPGFMGKHESADEESFSSGLLEYPHYTRPEKYRGVRVPDVLQGGDHKAIDTWRREQSLRITLARRPDLLDEARLSGEDMKILRAARKGGGCRRIAKNLYLSLLHAPVVNKFGHTVSTSLTNLDVHDIARVSRTCGLGGYYIATPLTDQRKLLDRLLVHWLEGPGSRANRDRSEAFGAIRAATDLDEIVRDIEARCGQAPVVIATSAKDQGGMTVGQVRERLAESPVLLVMGTAHGLAPEIIERADGTMRPVRYLSGYNHLSVRSATAMIVDRLLGDTL